MNNCADELFQKQREIGRALWLLAFYWSLQLSDECTWAWVQRGAVIRDSDVAAHLRVSVYTAARWRAKLLRAGMIQVFPRDGGYSVFAYRAPFAGRIQEFLDDPVFIGAAATEILPTTIH